MPAVGCGADRSPSNQTLIRSCCFFPTPDRSSPLSQYGGVHGSRVAQKTWRNKPLFRREGDVRFRTGAEAADMLVAEVKRRDAHETEFLQVMRVRRGGSDGTHPPLCGQSICSLALPPLDTRLPPGLHQRHDSPRARLRAGACMGSSGVGVAGPVLAEGTTRPENLV